MAAAAQRMGWRRLLPALAALALAGQAAADPFADLGAAYRARDGAAAAAVYTPDAIVTYRYDGAPEKRHIGTAAIARSFRQLFDQVDPATPLDLRFRFASRNATAATGVYRLGIGNTASYGRFTVTFAPDGRFATDLSTSAAAADFDALERRN